MYLEETDFVKWASVVYKFSKDSEIAFEDDEIFKTVVTKLLEEV